ncbi:hypothetical protein NDU88_000597 [Pleurodeles waltl]|uniref:Uncharacterized protein n=1 Tax=Pleurodeles waltl TaxID=8319 RepID=A0AAV7KMH3_PLEWA|nr:hypothetical protein NDU88_000597 [Pleurodeles waltl]
MKPAPHPGRPSPSISVPSSGLQRIHRYQPWCARPAAPLDLEMLPEKGSPFVASHVFNALQGRFPTKQIFLSAPRVPGISGPMYCKTIASRRSKSFSPSKSL